MRCGIWHWSSAASPGVSVVALSGQLSSAATSPTPARTCHGWPTCPPRARSRCSASSTVPTTTGGTLSIPPRHRRSANVLVACRCRFPARPSRFASALVGGLRCDCRSLGGCGFGCPARLAAWCATPRSPRMPSAGTSRSVWQPPPSPLRRTACRAAGWTSAWPVRRSSPTKREPRLMPSTLTAGQRRRLLGLERRKARQVTWAKKHNGGRYSNRLGRTISQIAKLRARQARRRQDFTHKLTTDLAKNHGWVAIEDLRVKGMTKSARGTREEPGRNVRAKAGLNRAVLDNAPPSGSASSRTRRPGLGRSCGSFGQRSRARPARPVASVTRSRGPGAAGCSLAPPAAMSSMRT